MRNISRLSAHGIRFLTETEAGGGQFADAEMKFLRRLPTEYCSCGCDSWPWFAVVANTESLFLISSMVKFVIARCVMSSIGWVEQFNSSGRLPNTAAQLPLPLPETDAGITEDAHPELITSSRSSIVGCLDTDVNL